MTALAASGRPASALAAYARMSERLADELGVDPAPETQALHTSILRQETPAEQPDAHAGPIAPGPAPALPGRGAELTLLDAALARAAGGRAELVVVEGEAGIGKSRLLQVFAGRAAAAGATVLSAASDEHGRALPLQIVVDALDSHLARAGPALTARLLADDAAVLAPVLPDAPADGARWPARHRARSPTSPRGGRCCSRRCGRSSPGSPVQGLPC